MSLGGARRVGDSGVTPTTQRDGGQGLPGAQLSLFSCHTDFPLPESLARLRALTLPVLPDAPRVKDTSVHGASLEDIILKNPLVRSGRSSSQLACILVPPIS